MIKYNRSGEKIWERLWGGSQDDFCFDMRIDSFDNIYLFGYTSSYGAGNFDMCIVKYNSTGDLQWFRNWGVSNHNVCYGGDLDSNNDPYIVGSIRDSVKDDQFCIVKYDKSGVYQWDHIWGDNGDEHYESITLDSNDNIYVVGQVFNGTYSYTDACIVKYNSSGSPQWNKTWGGSSYERFYSIALDTVNNIYIGGYTESFGSGLRDWCLVKFNNAGVLQWFKVWGDSSMDELKSIYIDSSDYIYLTGDMYNFGTLSDVILAKYDSSGNQLWYLNWGGNKDESGNDLILDSESDIYLAGYSSIFDSNYGDLCLIKFFLDSDQDGLSDSDEINIYFTDPFNPDTDGDGLSDSEEINTYNTDPLLSDTDGDGWSDGEEVLTYNTDPLDPDDYPTFPEEEIPGYEPILILFTIALFIPLLSRKVTKLYKS